MSSDPVADDLFKRLGISSNEDFDKQQKANMHLLNGKQGKGGGKGQQQQQQQQKHFSQEYQQGVLSQQQLQQQQQQQYQQQQNHHNHRQQQQPPTTLADQFSSNPFLPPHNQQHHNNNSSYSHSNTRASSSASTAAGNGPGISLQNQTAHRVPGSKDNDDVLERLGLCSNEEYAKKTKNEYRAAVEGLVEVQKRFSQLE